MRRFLPGAPAAVLLALLCGPASPPAAASPGGLRVAAVQLRVTAADLASRAAYAALIQEAVQRCLPFAPDLILFPEYTSAFLALLPYGGRIQGVQSLEEALHRVLQREPLAHDLRELFLLNSALAERSLRELFGGLARRYGVAIGAGTWFAPVDAGGRVGLVDRAVIFDSSGTELYAQDKVFLTPFEEEALGLLPGRLTDARTFLLKGSRLALTICRDSFFEEWDALLAGAELWVDLKANGEPFTQAARQSFQRALPARLRESGVPYGLTVCLTGELAGLAWEGESFLSQQADGAVRTLKRAASADSGDILFFTLPGGD
jgi:predicted amidohydrolase